MRNSVDDEQEEDDKDDDKLPNPHPFHTPSSDEIIPPLCLRTRKRTIINGEREKKGYYSIY